MPWWTSELWALRHKLKAAQKKWYADKSEASKVAKIIAKSTYQKAIRNAKSSTWMKLSITLNNDRNAAIKFVTQTEPSVDLPSQISVNDKIITNPTDILNECARHLFPPDPPSNSAHREVEKCAKEISSSCDTEPPPDLTTRELSEALGALQHDAAPGPDGMNAPILSLCLTIIRPLFHQLLSSCIASSYFPQAWRHARIRIISKHKSEFSTLHSFRPTSVINTSAKVLEKVTLARFCWTAKQGNWFSKLQHGFQSERSTEAAAHDFISYIENGFSQNKKRQLFSSISKAPSTAHGILQFSRHLLQKVAHQTLYEL